ncbi:hypothetical protein ACUVAJ_000062 [Vibrio cholerae]
MVDVGAEATSVGEESNWPDFYPKDILVPPADSSPASGDFYRLVLNDPPTRSCFLSTHEEQPNRHKGCRDVYAKQNVYGLSVFELKEQANDTREKFRNALGKRLLSKGHFINEDGQIKKTFSPGHHTVWLRVDANPQIRFNVISEEKQK